MSEKLLFSHHSANHCYSHVFETQSPNSNESGVWFFFFPRGVWYSSSLRGVWFSPFSRGVWFFFFSRDVWSLCSRDVWFSLFCVASSFFFSLSSLDCFDRQYSYKIEEQDESSENWKKDSSEALFDVVLVQFLRDRSEELLIISFSIIISAPFRHSAIW